MCEPTSVLVVASMVAAGASAYQASSARKAGAEYDAAVARNNAQVAQWKAADAEDRATTNAMNIGRHVNDTRGKQSAALAANGLDIGFGSAAGSLEKTDYFGLVDQKTAIENGNNEAWGLRQQASQYKTQAEWSSSKAGAENPWLSAGMSMLGSAGSVADKWGKTSSVDVADPRAGVRGQRGY